jgi:hypothetical protein
MAPLADLAPKAVAWQRGLRVVLHHLIQLRNRQQLRANAGGWFGGVARAAADPPPQLGQGTRVGVELGAQLLELVLLSNDQRTDCGDRQ